MSGCRSCGMDVEPVGGACPECGAPMDDGTQSFSPVSADRPEVALEGAVSAEPVLVVQKGPEVGERFSLDPGSYSVGRDPQSDIFLNDVTVSRRHAEIAVGETGVSLSDVGSLNGTYVNSVRVDQARLQHGDVVQVGRFEMIFLAGGTG